MFELKSFWPLFHDINSAKEIHYRNPTLPFLHQENLYFIMLRASTIFFSDTSIVFKSNNTQYN